MKSTYLVLSLTLMIHLLWPADQALGQLDTLHFNALYDSLTAYTGTDIDKSLDFAERIVKDSRSMNAPYQLIKGYRWMGLLNRRKNQFDRADSLLLLSISEATKLKDQKGQAKGWLEMGDVSYFKGKLYESVERYQQSADLFTQAADSNSLCQVYKLQGYSLVELSEIELATRTLTRCYTICLDKNQNDNATSALNSMGILYAKQGEHHRADSIYQMVLEIHLNQDNDFNLGGSYNNIGITQKNLGNYPQAIISYDKALEYQIKADNLLGEMNVKLNQGILANLMLDYDLALNLAGATISEASDQPRFRPQLIESYKVYAQAYRGKKDLDSALSFASKAIDLMDPKNNKNQLQDLLELRSNIYQEIGSHQKALLDFKNAIAHRDTIFDLEKSKRTAQLREKFESDIKAKEIALLGANAELDRVKNNRLIGGMIVLATIGLGLVFFLINKRKKDKAFFQMDKELQNEKIAKEQLEKEQLKMDLEFKQQEMMAKALQIYNKNELLANLQDQVKELKKTQIDTDNRGIDRIARQIEIDIQSNPEWDSFLLSFSEIHRDFMVRLRKNFDRLTSNQIRLICLIKMDLSTKEIANIMNISMEGVKKAKHRLKKKMGVNADVGLTEFIHAA